jgi:K+-sensing histidine kinase KdpD
MKIRNSKKWSKYSTHEALIGSFSLVFLAFAFRSLLHPLVEPYAVFHFFIVATLTVQYFFGYKFSVFSIIVSIFLGEYYFVKPYGEFNALSDKDFIISLNFALVTLTAVAFMEPLRRSLYARHLLLKVLSSRHKISLLRENDRIFYAQQSDQVGTLLHTLLEDFDQILIIKLSEFDFKVGPLLIKRTQNAALLDAKDGWQQAIYEEDKALLAQAWQGVAKQSAALNPFDLRLVHGNGGVVACRVRVERRLVMGKAIAILKLSDSFNSLGVSR